MPSDSSEATERVAVARVRAGDRDAYANLVRMHARAAYRAAVFFGAGPDAEDVVQAAFVKAYEAFGQFRDGAPFRPWLLRIVQNEAKNAARAASRRRSATERYALRNGHLSAGLDADPVERALTGERERELLELIRELPEPQRQVIVCRFFLDLSEKDAATVLGCRAGTVKSRLHRALERLRAKLPDNIREVDHEH